MVRCNSVMGTICAWQPTGHKQQSWFVRHDGARSGRGRFSAVRSGSRWRSPVFDLCTDRPAAATTRPSHARGGDLVMPHACGRSVHARRGRYRLRRAARRDVARHRLLTARRLAALRAFVRRTGSSEVARGKPGSYSWPLLRQEAEQRFAAGHDPRTVITELRDRHADCPAMAPSVRTMRRWYTQARWLASSPHRPRRTHEVRRRAPAELLFIPDALARHVPWDLVPRWRGT